MNQPMRHLIIGCGYLGMRVAALWKKQGHQVLGTSRRQGGPAEFQTLGIEPVLCDILDAASLQNLPQADTVLFAVGFDRGAGPSMRTVYVDGLANVLRHLPRPDKFLYVSSSSVYGQADGAWVDENSATVPQEESGQIVLDAEKVLLATLPQARILRSAGIYGPGRLLRQKAMEAGEPIVADPDRWLNLIQVEDGARAVLTVQEKSSPGQIVNVCDTEPVPRHVFYTELARVLHAPLPRFVLPPPNMPTPPHEQGNRRIGNDRLVKELGFSFLYPTFREGLAASVSFNLLRSNVH